MHTYKLQIVVNSLALYTDRKVSSECDVQPGAFEYYLCFELYGCIPAVQRKGWIRHGSPAYRRLYIYSTERTKKVY